MADESTALVVQRHLRWGWITLLVFLTLGLGLESLHGFKVQAYLASDMRREMWRLAHAHGTLLGILCLVSALLAEAHIAEAIRPRVLAWVRWGAVLMPLGFFLGGVLNSEGDPSLGIVLVPVGAVLLVVALVRVAVAPRAR